MSGRGFSFLFYMQQPCQLLPVGIYNKTIQNKTKQNNK